MIRNPTHRAQASYRSPALVSAPEPPGGLSIHTPDPSELSTRIIIVEPFRGWRNAMIGVRVLGWLAAGCVGTLYGLGWGLTTLFFLDRWTSFLARALVQRFELVGEPPGSIVALPHEPRWLRLWRVVIRKREGDVTVLRHLSREQALYAAVALEVPADPAVEPGSDEEGPDDVSEPALPWLAEDADESTRARTYDSAARLWQAFAVAQLALILFAMGRR